MSDTTNKSDDGKDKKALVPISVGERGLVLRDFDEMWRFANAVARSGFAPPSFKSPEAIFVALQGGLELGFWPMQSLQNLIVVKGKLGMYVATARALVESHPLCEWIKDNMDELSGITDWKDDVKATVEAKRKGRPESVKRCFSVSDAKRAGLWAKVGKSSGEPTPWVTYPGRMLYARAMGWLLNDLFADVVRGIRTVEEMADLPDERPRTELKSGDEIEGDVLNRIAEQLDGTTHDSTEPDLTKPANGCDVVTSDPSVLAATPEEGDLFGAEESE